MRAKIGLGFSLLMLLGVIGAQAAFCNCTCESSCTVPCTFQGTVTNCANLGICADLPGCSGGGGGCLTASHMKSLLAQILERPASVSVVGAQRSATARLTWHLTQHVEEGKLGEVFTAGTGFFLVDGLGKRSPELAFVSREHAREAEVHGAFQLSPDLVAEFLSPSNSATIARRDAQSWIKAGTQAVLIVDSTRKTVSVYRVGKVLEEMGQGSFVDLSGVVPGWTLRVDDLFE